MKICIPTIGTGGLDAPLGRMGASGTTYTIVDTSDGGVTVIVPAGTGGGPGDGPWDLLKRSGVEALVAEGIDKGSKRKLEERGIEVRVGAVGPVREALMAFEGGRDRRADDDTIFEYYTYLEDMHCFT